MMFDALMRRVLCVLGLLSVFSAAVPRAAAQAPPAAPAQNPPEKPADVGRNATQRDTREIQRFLKVAETGAYDAATTAAAVKFQKSKSLPADGVWGPDTDVVAFKRKPFLKTAKTAVTTSNGTPVEGRKITGLNVHHTATTSDQRAYFAGKNGRESCPTLYIKSDGSVIEFIRPKMQPWSTGRGDLDRIAVEIQNETGEPEWKISDKAGDALVDLLVELATAKTIDGCPVEFKLDREHVKGHREFNATACPGPYVFSKLDEYIARAADRVKSAK